MVKPYLISSIPEHQLAEFHRLMSEEIEDVAVFFMDTHGVITVWNRAAEVMKGYTAQEAIGQHLSMLYTEEQRANGWAEHNLGEARKHGFYKEETWRRRKDGTRFWARIALTALKDPTGKLLGFSKITMDLTEHKLLESCVKEREQTRRVLRAANAGTWTWRPDLDQVDISENFLRLLGHTGGDTSVPFATWIGFIVPEDRAQFASRLEEARQNIPGDALSMEMRMGPAGGEGERWFYVHADWHREKDDAPWQLSGVNVDIHGLKKAEAELRTAVAKLTEADRRKDEFLAMLAHELRNPLAPIRSAAEVLRRSQLDEQRLRRTSDVIARQADHMTSLVDDLLDVSRVTRGLVELTHERIDVRQIVVDATEQVSPMLESRRHRLMVHHAPAAVVRGDKKRLVQVVANLLNNAAKFTPEGGKIEVTTEVREGKVLLSVIDDGIGMKPDTAARVFDLFAQAERTPDRSAGGLGLGLALVKSLVELHGGAVTAFSAGLGSGSTFTVWLPLADPAGAEAEAAIQAGASEAAGTARITVVDDNADAAEMLGMLLEASGHEVTVEHSARRALDRSKADPADIYLLDIGLPEIDGYELARALKSQPETAESVLIAVTGYGQEADRAHALAAGFSHHLVKPVNPEKLLTMLDRLDVMRRNGTDEPGD
ncbi:MAG: ATP-binding protein [Ramlibacter sp.]